MLKKTAKTIALASFAIFASASASASLITVSTSDNQVRPGMDNQGWWRTDIGNSNATNDNYYTREGTHRSYFSFDLAGLTGVVTSAVLELRRYTTDVGSTLELFDVDTSAADLAQRQVVNNAIYDDLGTGTSYGTFVAGSGNSEDVMSFVLNAAALSDISAALGSFFSIGGTSYGGTHFSSSGGEPGNSSTNFTQQLVLNVESSASVPNPATLALVGLGLAGIGLSRRKKANSSK